MGNDAQWTLSEELGRKIGPQVPSGHGTVGRQLNGDPPLGGDVALPLQPVPNQCLTGIPVNAVGAHLVGEGFLPPGNLDSPPERSNVRLFHRPEAYTTTVVKRNTPGCMTADNTGCNVTDIVDLRERRITRLAKPSRKTGQSSQRETRGPAIPGPDGKTLGQRLSEAMSYHEGVIGRKYTPQDLFRDVNRLLNAPPDSPAISQQSISKILVSDSSVTNSANSVYFARVLGVDAVWLSGGIGSKFIKQKD